MQINNISNYSQPSFGKYLKPNKETQELIESYISGVEDYAKKEKLTGEYASLIEKQKDNDDATIIMEKAMGSDEIPRLVISIPNEIGCQACFVYDFPELVKVMREANAKANAQRGRLINETKTVWNA